jgi:spermidine synthase
MSIFTFISICFLLSGATALIYEVIWVRLLALTFGNTVYAVGVVLTAFMSGLSLGSLLLGRFSDRKGVNLLKTYGYLELGIALFAVLSPELLDAVTSLYLSTYSSSAPMWILSGQRYALSIAVLLIPTTLMGGTLPVLSRFFIRSEQELEKKVGSLYSLNTIGGVLGTFLVGFILIRFLGLNFTLRSTAVFNVLIGLAAFYMGTIYTTAEEHEPEVKIKGKRKNKGKGKREKTSEAVVESTERPAGYRYALIAFFLSGFTAMVYEVAWSRLLVGVIGSTTYAFSMILMGFLLGIGLGSYIVSLLSGKRRFDLFHFSIIQIAIGVTCFLTIAIFRIMPDLMLKGFTITGRSYTGILTLEFCLVLIFLLLPTTLFGATFPIIAGVYSGGREHRGKNIGNIYASNTAGAILGSAFAAFLFLPLLSSTVSIKTATVINILVGITGFAVLRRPKFTAASVLLLIIVLLPVSIPQKLLDSGVAIYGMNENFLMKQKNSHYLYQKEGLNATISVSTGQSGHLVLKTNGKVDASTRSDMSTQVAVAYFPLLLHNDARDVLVVGVGSGVTIKAVRDFQGTRIDAVEIEPAVMEAAGYFEMFNGGVINDKDINYVIEDARSFMTVTDKKYDVIISEPSNPWISGIGNLFTKEYYELSVLKLKEGGIFCQWVQLYNLRPDEMTMILNTFSSVFTHTNIWHSQIGDMILMGSMTNFSGLDYQAVAKKIRGKMRKDLKVYLNISDPLDFFSYFITGTAGVRLLSKDALINTDDSPFLEFNAPYSMYNANTIVANNMFLFKYMRLPRITGYDAEKNITAELLYRKSRNYLKIKLIPSLSWINRSLIEDPGNPDYLVQRARGFKAMEKPAEAAEALEKVISIAPENASAHFERGMLFVQNNMEKAFLHLEKAVSLRDDIFQYVYELALLKIKEQKHDEALPLLLKSYESPHNIVEDASIFYLIGHCHIKAGQFEEALDYLDRSIDANSYNATPVYRKGDVYLFFLNDPEKACEMYRKALQISDEIQRGKIETRLGKSCNNL